MPYYVPAHLARRGALSCNAGMEMADIWNFRVHPMLLNFGVSAVLSGRAADELELFKPEL